MSGVVIDLGCAPVWKRRSTTERLIKRFKPTVYFGFDPQAQASCERRGQTAVSISTLAAWRYTGMAPFDGVAPRLQVVGKHETEERVSCFDFADWLQTLPERPKAIKMTMGRARDLAEHLDWTFAGQPWTDLLLIDWGGKPPLLLSVPTEEDVR